MAKVKLVEKTPHPYTFLLNIPYSRIIFILFFSLLKRERKLRKQGNPRSPKEKHSPVKHPSRSPMIVVLLQPTRPNLETILTLEPTSGSQSCYSSFKIVFY